MEYRLNKSSLIDILQNWNHFLRRRVRLVACGGTAMTLIGVKESTKDIDFIVPDHKEYAYLLSVLADLEYKPITAAGWKKEGDVFVFDLFRGNKIHTTELLESPLAAGRNQEIKRFSHLYVGVLNFYDLISSKIFRGSTADIDDCTQLYRAKSGEIDIQTLTDHYREMVSYDTSEARIAVQIDHFVEHLREEGLL